MSESEEDVQFCEVDLVIPHFRDGIRQVEGRQTRICIHSEDQLLTKMEIMLKFFVFVNGKDPESENFLSVTILPKKIPSNRQSPTDVIHTLWGVLSVTDNNGDHRFSQSFGWDYSRTLETAFPPIVIEKLVKCCTLLNDPDEYFPGDQLKMHCTISCTENLPSADRPVDEFFPVFFDFPSEDHTESILTIETAEGTEYRLNFDTPLFAYLKAESPVFRAMAELDVRERQDQSTVILPDEYPAFRLLEKVLSTSGIGHFTSFEHLYQLYTITDKYQLSRVHEMCSDILGSGINVDNVIDLLILADRHSNERLKSEAIRYLYEHWLELRLSNRWLKLLQDYPGLAATIQMFIYVNYSDSSEGATALEQITGESLNKSLATVSSYIN